MTCMLCEDIGVHLHAQAALLATSFRHPAPQCLRISEMYASSNTSSHTAHAHASNAAKGHSGTW